MKILGLDIATNTGYCILEDGNLLTYGMLNIPPEMNLFQRISFFETNLNKILTENNIDFVALEDVLLGISGAKTLAYLARLNGIAISCCYKKVQNNIKLFMPGEWKANSFPNLNGAAKKVEIQIAVCKHYNLIPQEQLDVITKPLGEINDRTDDVRKQIEDTQNDIKRYTAFLSRKKNGPKTPQEKKAFEVKIRECKEKIEALKGNVKDIKKNIDDIYKNVSLEIMSKCGLTCDVSDSIGIAYCAWKKLSTGTVYHHV